MNAVEVGRYAPDFVARDLAGKEVRLSSLIAGRKALLLFYRGGWCPFCNEQVAAISRDYEKFQELNAMVVAVSGEEVQKGKDLLQKLHLPFVLLVDASFEAIDAYGVRNLDVPETLKANGRGQLPKPSAFVIDETGIVLYKYVGKNAPDRPKNEDLLRALRRRQAEGDRPDADESVACRLQEEKLDDRYQGDVRGSRHLVPTLPPYYRRAATEIGLGVGIDFIPYDIDKPEEERKADDLVREFGDASEDYLIPQVFLEMKDGQIRHVLTGYSESVELTKRAVNNLMKSPYFKGVTHVN